MDANKLIAELTEACEPIVAAIEASPEVTKDRYDQYMAAIAKISDKLGGGATAARIAGVALVYAKANKQGVQAALRVMGYL